MRAIVSGIFLAELTSMAHAQSGNSVPVTVDNFARAESDLYLGNLSKERGGIPGQRICSLCQCVSLPSE